MLSKVGSAKEDIKYWQLANELEEGRNHVLRMVARNESLELILNTLCQKAQAYNNKMLCSVLRLDNNSKTLHSIASVSLPEFYCQAIDGVSIGAGVGSCGTAAFTQQRVIVDDINTHPYWNQYKELALSAGLQACWSEPIIGAGGIVYGTFAMYYSEPKTPTAEDLKFIELSANLAAVVFENHANRERLLNANNLLNTTINERNAELERVNLALEQAMEEQSQQYRSDLKIEKMLTTNSLISGFSHEISTPVGIALTAISAVEDKLNAIHDKVLSKQLTRSYLLNKTEELSEIIVLNKRALLKVNKLLQRFKDVNTLASEDSKSQFSVQGLLGDVSNAMAAIVHPHQLVIQCDEIELVTNKEALWQVFFNLIENSVVHGFEDKAIGLIHINVVAVADEIIINYQDNGCGISEEKTANIFEPFYTSSRHKKSLGLGLSITNNLINHNLNGRIRLIESPLGVRYEISIPKTVL